MKVVCLKLLSTMLNLLVKLKEGVAMVEYNRLLRVIRKSLTVTITCIFDVLCGLIIYLPLMHYLKLLHILWLEFNIKTKQVLHIVLIEIYNMYSMYYNYIHISIIIIYISCHNIYKLHKLKFVICILSVICTKLFSSNY